VKKNINWMVFKYDDLKLYIAATEKGLCYVGSPGQTFDEFSGVVHKRFPNAELVENEELLTPYSDVLSEYFEGTRQSLSMPIDVKGTPFQEEIWEALKEIPFGETLSYSDIAGKIGKPAAVRAVGTAIGANPVLITVPCHRVIGKNGAITGYRGGAEMKQYLLDLERKYRGNPAE
jgi:methylated-DNA-[protein]-cysteine S-methyltransferase